MVEGELKTPKLLEDLGTRWQGGKYRRYGIYKCPYCNNEFKTQTTKVKSGHTKSCGCIRKEKATHHCKNILKRINTKHGLHKSRIYSIYTSIKDRCYNINNDRYLDWGGRGIKVCDYWLIDFVNFYNWALENGYNKSLSIDRINVDGNYEPNNCRWATREVQARNSRRIRKNNTSGFRGVSWRTTNKKYIVKIKVSNVDIFLGTFSIPEKGALAYDTYVRKHNLEHTKNFSDEEYYKLLEKYKNV